MLERLRQNLKWILAAGILCAGAGGYVSGCIRGEDAAQAEAFLDGYNKGQKDSVCDGGSHYRPFAVPEK